MVTHDQEMLRQVEMKRLGSRARRLREAAGLTQEDVADLVGVTRATINRFEGGRHDLGSSRLTLLARAVRASPRELWD